MDSQTRSTYFTFFNEIGIIEQLVEAGEILDHIERRGRFDSPTALHLTRQIASALAYLLRGGWHWDARMEAAIEAGAEDCISAQDGHEIVSAPDELGVRRILARPEEAPAAPEIRLDPLNARDQAQDERAASGVEETAADDNDTDDDGAGNFTDESAARLPAVDVGTATGVVLLDADELKRFSDLRLRLSGHRGRRSRRVGVRGPASHRGRGQ